MSARHPACTAAAVAWLAGILPTPCAAVDEPGIEADPPVALEALRVTGTRVASDEPARLPLTVLTRTELEAGGALRLAEALRTLPWNNRGARSQGLHLDSAPALGTVDLRGAGPGRTLVLLDGRRLALAPGSLGRAANLNQVPLSAVERVEILRDGASAVYGSDAIGGVVNIVLRDERDGLRAAAAATGATRGAHERKLELAGGWGAGPARLFWFVDALRREAMDAIDAFGDPERLVRRFNPVGEPGTWYPTDAFGDGTGVPGPWTANADCPPQRRVGLPPWRAVDPSTGLPGTPRAQSLCALALDEDHDWSPRLDMLHALARLRWEGPAGTRWNARWLHARLEAEADLTTGGDLPDAIGTDNPLNPAWDPAAGRAPSPVTLLFGLHALGDVRRRNSTVFNGLSVDGARPLGAGEWVFGAQWDRTHSDQDVANLALRGALRAAIAAGRLDPFAQRHDPSVLDALRYTQRSASRTGAQLLDAGWRAAWVRPGRAARSITLYLGAELRHEAFSHRADPEDLAMNVFRWVPGGIDVDADRAVRSLFLEGELELPHAWRAGYAVRHDDYGAPQVSATTHKLTASWAPFRALTLRASWGEGFRAPSLLESFAPAVPGLAFNVIDRVRCAGASPSPGPGSPPLAECFPTTLLGVELAGPDLAPERSTHAIAGVAWRPVAGLKLEADAWRLDIDGQIATPSVQELLDLEAAGLLPAGAYVVREGGIAREVGRPRLNRPSAAIRGFDLGLEWSGTAGGAGSVSAHSWWSLLERYRVTTLPGAAAAELVDAEVPAWKSRSGLSFRRGDVTGRLTVYGTAAVGAGAARRSAWWRCDLEVEWRFAGDTHVGLGVRNLADAHAGPFDTAHYDIDGRTWFARASHRF